MKRFDIDNVFTARVTEYLMDGWTINTTSMNGHQGEDGKIDLVKGDELIRIWLHREMNDADFRDESAFHGYKMVLRIGRWNRPAKEAMDGWSTVWIGDLEVICSKEFYMIGGSVSNAWYTEDMEEAKRVQQLHRQRRRKHTFDNKTVTIMMTDNVRYVARDYLRKIGYKRISWNDIKVVKTVYPNGNAKYVVCYRNNEYKLH